MKRRKRLNDGTLGELEEVFEKDISESEMMLFAALAELEEKREQDKMDNLLALAELAAIIEGGTL